MIAVNTHLGVTNRTYTADNVSSATETACWYHEELAMAFDVSRMMTDFEEVSRLLCEFVSKFKTKRPRNKSTLPTALLTPKRPTLGWIKYRPNQQASTYG